MNLSPDTLSLGMLCTVGWASNITPPPQTKPNYPFSLKQILIMFSFHFPFPLNIPDRMAPPSKMIAMFVRFFFFLSLFLSLNL